MNFKEYPHIRNSSADGLVESCRAAVPATELWVAFEKLHGSNGALYTDGTDVKMARRSAFLGPRDTFHGSDRVLAQYGDAARAICRVLKRGPIAIYGEYFGGLYPHALVKKHANVSAVQKGIFYSPDLCFRVFDICILTTGVFLPVTQLIVECAAADIPIAPFVRIGTLDQVLGFDVETFCTQIPAALGLPPIPVCSNIAEGLVIRPYEHEYLLADGDRVMIKKKSVKFREVAKDVGKESRAATGDITAADATSFINEARLRSVLSKELERRFEHKGHVFALVPLLAADVMGEIEREHPTIASLPAAELKAFQRRLGDAIKELLGKHTDALMTGTF